MSSVNSSASNYFPHTQYENSQSARSTTDKFLGQNRLRFDLQSALDNSARAKNSDQAVAQLLAGLANYFASGSAANQFDSKSLLENLRSALGTDAASKNAGLILRANEYGDTQIVGGTDADKHGGVGHVLKGAEPYPGKLDEKSAGLILRANEHGDTQIVGGTDADKHGGVGHVLKGAEPYPGKLDEKSAGLILRANEHGDTQIVGGTDADKHGGVGHVLTQAELYLKESKQATYKQVASDLLSGLHTFLRSDQNDQSVIVLRDTLTKAFSGLNNGSDTSGLLSSLQNVLKNGV